MSRLTVAAAGLAVLAAACSPPPEPAAAPLPAPAETAQATVDQTAATAVTTRGKVSVVGSAPVNIQVMLQTENHGALQITGPLADELRRANGTVIEAQGEQIGQQLEVAEYRVVSVDGQPAWMGTVERGPSGGLQLRTSDGSVVALRGATAQFEPGQKVWVQGPPTVEVQAYGVIGPR